MFFITSRTFAAANPFSDMPAGHWAYDAVTQLAADGIVKGYGDSTYLGNRNITRYEMAMMVARVYAKNAKIPYSAINPFSDIPKDHWAKKAVVLLADAGIIEGYGDKTYLGDRNITRYEMAVMIARVIKKEKINLELKRIDEKVFSDIPLEHWAYDSVNLLAKSSIVEGYGDGTYLGDRNITRYEMAQMIAKAMKETHN